ncbi:hypothetical protein GLYMA_13G356332v4 [Glycine max]|nr:hypothetical protein GLYMA_13G356332v4 [Glycine max]KAH1105096.1 hypothetical protein GYH30_038398 [Glycine max]
MNWRGGRCWLLLRLLQWFKINSIFSAHLCIKEMRSIGTFAGQGHIFG